MTSDSKNKILNALHKSKLFDQFSDSDLSNLISFSTVEFFQKGDLIIEEGTTNDRVFVIIEGVVGVYANEEYILSLDRVGDLVGEMSVITKKLTTAAVVAETQVELFTISSEKINTSGGVKLQSMIYKIFLDILTEKLTVTTKQVKGFQATKDELAISEDILKSVLESMSDGVVVCDMAGKLLHINEAFINMIGNVTIPLSFEEWPEAIGIYQKDATTLYEVEKLPMVQATCGKQIDTEEIFVKNDQLEEGVWFQASARPLKGKDKSEGAVVVFRDYTKKKKEEQALIRAKENAEATAKAKSEFLAIMSHELRTPLNGIIGMTDLLFRSELNEDQKDCMETIRTSSETLLHIIKNVLDFSNLESGKLTLTPAPFALKDCIETVITRKTAEAGKKGLNIVSELSPDLPLAVQGDQERIQQILLNIVDNAIKFSQEGTVKITLKQNRNNQDKSELLFTIEDQGIGIAPEHKETLFTPFSQVDTSFARKFEGTGIGLSICKKLVEKMNGTIWVESELNQGSTFYFSIQTDKVELPQTDAVKPPKKKKFDPGFATDHPCRILVAEDNAGNRKLIGKVLGKLGYEPIFAENGLLAVEASRGAEYDLILMDLQMPEMDGQEASKIIIDETPEEKRPKIIALTANVMDGIRESCLEAGMVDYMTKPLRIDKLAVMLQKWF